MSSSLTIGYSHIIKAAEKRIDYMEKNYQRMKLEGRISAWQADHNMACDKTLLRLLKKHEKNPQLNLNELFDQMKK